MRDALAHFSLTGAPSARLSELLSHIALVAGGSFSALNSLSTPGRHREIGAVPCHKVVQHVQPRVQLLQPRGGVNAQIQ